MTLRKVTAVALMATAIFLALNIEWGRADSPPMEERYLIQLTFPGLPKRVDNGEDVGRVDVYVGDRFIGCATPVFIKESASTGNLYMSAVGFTARGKKDDIKVSVEGELEKYGDMHTRITRADIPIINPTGGVVR